MLSCGQSPVARDASDIEVEDGRSSFELRSASTTCTTVVAFVLLQSSSGDANHCAASVSCRSLEDTSTNGTFVNNVKVGKGHLLCACGSAVIEHGVLALSVGLMDLTASPMDPSCSCIVVLRGRTGEGGALQPCWTHRRTPSPTAVWGCVGASWVCADLDCYSRWRWICAAC